MRQRNTEKQITRLNTVRIYIGLQIGIANLLPYRGVQYVHCVMHKYIKVKVGGNEKHKVCKKTRKFYEIKGGTLEK